MYCSRTLTPSGGRAEQLRGGALGAMPTTKKVLTRAEAKAMALRDGVEQVVLTQDVDDMQRVANERKERAEGGSHLLVHPLFAVRAAPCSASPSHHFGVGEGVGHRHIPLLRSICHQRQNHQAHR